MKNITLNGEDLKIPDIYVLVSDPTIEVELDKGALEKTRKAKHFLNQHLDQQVIYGINTGFGPMASTIIGKGQLFELQKNLVRSHAVGMGKPIADEYVLAAMLIRLNMFLKGYSGVSEKLILRLQEFINHRIIPVVPEHGAVGTSGDLVQLAHIALALIGEGEVSYQNGVHPTSDILKKLNLEPTYTLEPKEGLALINGTAVMTGIAAIVCHHAENLLNLSIHNGALALELVHCFKDSLSETLHQLRPHHGQNEVAKKLRSILTSSKLLRDRQEFNSNNKVSDETHLIPESVQDVYSLRCIAQILGPVLDTLLHVKNIVTTEINSVNDNPIVDEKNQLFIHGGNFHGDYIASAADQIKIALIKLTMLSERRINYFLNHKVNNQFPPFLNALTPGLTLALQGMQFVATSTTSQSQTLAFPQHIHSIPTNADNQDVVSMGTEAALFAAKVVENGYIVLAIEVAALAQAVDIKNEAESLSPETKQLFNLTRGVLPTVQSDRSLSEELNNLVVLLKK